MGKYVKVLAILGIALGLVIFFTMFSSRGYRDQPLQAYLPCDTSQIIYVNDLGARQWTAGAPYAVPQYRTATISIDAVKEELAPYTRQYVYSVQKLSEKSFDAQKAYAFYDGQGSCLFELYSKDDTVIVHTLSKSTKLKRRKK